MTKIPLEKRLKKTAHKKLASAQDLLIDVIYAHFPRAVVHGGTAIWRCYNGNRFSEDIDVYVSKKSNEDEIFNNFLTSLKSRGFVVKKFKRTANSIFSKFELSGVEIRFEAVFKNVKNFLVKPFELADGTFANVYTLSPEDLLLEKFLAYKNRKKIRDLYDIWFLSNSVDITKIKQHLDFSIEEPKDYDSLKALIIFGAIPSIKDLVEGVRLWVKKNM
ncbi:MAG: nucleotidyl transferase AbiEii/AbiGii toxin family protein [Candidatus Aenigmarchaeota archaeon]|nr:nucleotidyl transferase AbiEii/AbiGii toxin family protein [Candidatus Aenigmarchaeota archaeon]